VGETGARPRRDRGRQRAGLFGTIVGVAAAGVAAGVAAERALVRRTRRGVPDPHREEPFGRLPYDEKLMVTTPRGVDIYVEVVDPTDGVELEADFAARMSRSAPAVDPTIVFAPGFCLDMGTFHFQRKELTRRGDWRAVYYDQPGHGRSGKLDSGHYDLADLGEVLRTVVAETVPDGPVVLVGHSMGGMAVFALAERYPEFFADRVVGVVLISTSAGRLDGYPLAVPEMIARLGWPLVAVVNSSTKLTGGVIDRARSASTDLAWLLTRRYGFGGARPSAALVSYVERMNSRTSTETVVRYLRTLYSHARYRALETLRHSPVLVVCGDKDAITPLAHSEEITRYLPDAELVIVPDSGHVALLEHADDVTAALLAFLEKIE